MNLRNLSLHKLTSVNATMFDGGHGNCVMTTKLFPFQDSSWLLTEYKSATWQLLLFICCLSSNFQISVEICSPMPTALQQDVHYFVRTRSVSCRSYSRMNTTEKLKMQVHF